MAQQISVEDAFPVFRDRCRELGDENLILRAQVAVLERRVAEVEEENLRLRQQAEMPRPATPLDEPPRP